MDLPPRALLGGPVASPNPNPLGTRQGVPGFFIQESMTITIEAPPLVRGPIRYRNQFRWRVMPPDGAAQEGFFDRSFETKKEAVAYQKKVKAKFPEEACCLLDTGRWFDSSGKPIH